MACTNLYYDYKGLQGDMMANFVRLREEFWSACRVKVKESLGSGGLPVSHLDP